MSYRLWLLAIALAACGAVQAEPVPQAQARGLSWTLAQPHGDARLRLADERGEVFDVALGRWLHWSLEGRGLPDGSYRYELTVAPPQAARRGAEGQERGDASPGFRQSGSFTVRDGRLLEATLETASPRDKQAVRAKDLVVADDRIVLGQSCTGFDCVNNEVFGRDTVRLKANNTRLGFDDTSGAGFPAVDWEWTANDNASGAQSAFTLLQRTDNRQPFRLLAPAPARTLGVAANGWVGIHSPAPQQRLHLTVGDTPSLRLDQDNGFGFSPYIWQVQANESFFGVRDMSLGAVLPFRIAAGSPAGAITIAPGVSVGFGTPAPAATLHVARSDGGARVKVEDTDATAANRTLLEARNRGGPALAFTGVEGGWTLAGGAAFSLQSTQPAAGSLQLDDAGNLAINGTLSQGSSRTLKHAIAAVSPADLLRKVSALPVYSWQYLAGGDGRHLGPMAEDVYAAFGWGPGERALAPGDLAGLAVAATRALREELAARDAELDALLVRLEALEAHAAGAP